MEIDRARRSPMKEQIRAGAEYERTTLYLLLTLELGSSGHTSPDWWSRLVPAAGFKPVGPTGGEAVRFDSETSLQYPPVLMTIAGDCRYARDMSSAVSNDLRTWADLRAHLSASGARPVHLHRLLRTWLSGRPFAQTQERADARMSRGLVASISSLQAVLDALTDEVVQAAAPDGSRRRLLRLRSGRTVEMVDLPRHGLCVSTQVGCAVGCRFCRTGEDGLAQQLGSLEILAQVVRARAARRVDRVVFMGMGEPAHNLEAVCEAITALGESGGFGHKNLVFSTVGDPEVFDRLAARRVRPALALSLHTLDPRLRSSLLPRAPHVPPVDLLLAALDYADRVAHPLLVQWTVLAGVNDTPAEAVDLAQRIRGRRAIVNYIPFNAVEGNGFVRPRIEDCVQLVRAVRGAGVLATLRMSAGQDVDAGCGQLRARNPATPVS
jgi:23S rRNA (adenine2503-C2)-methyltransferase